MATKSSLDVYEINNEDMFFHNPRSFEREYTTLAGVVAIENTKYLYVFSFISG